MSSRRGRLPQAEERQGAPAWMVTYGDMTTLILCFFVVLFGFSQIDRQKFEAVISSIRTAFQVSSVGVLPGGKTLTDQPGIAAGDLFLGTGAERIRAELAELASTYRALEAYIDAQGLAGKLGVTQEERGLVIRFVDRTLFDLGKAELKASAQEILDEVGAIIKQTKNHIRVEGHTNSLPINTKEFPSNWELSTARATNVVRYLIQEQQITPSRLSAAGYGEYRPLVPNDSLQNMAQNRRVDIVLLRTSLSEGEPQSILEIRGEENGR